MTPPPGNYKITSRLSKQGVAINPLKKDILEETGNIDNRAKTAGNPGPGSYTPMIGLKEK
jgi:hypothetical protein